jgi:hypothetical protein
MPRTRVGRTRTPRARGRARSACRAPSSRGPACGAPTLKARLNAPRSGPVRHALRRIALHRHDAVDRESIGGDTEPRRGEADAPAPSCRVLVRSLVRRRRLAARRRPLTGDRRIALDVTRDIGTDSSSAINCICAVCPDRAYTCRCGGDRAVRGDREPRIELPGAWRGSRPPPCASNRRRGSPLKATTRAA